MPNPSSKSKVAGWKVDALKSFDKSSLASYTSTNISALASKYARVKPTGPAPTIITLLLFEEFRMTIS
jgi:hypothetical protein